MGHFQSTLSLKEAFGSSLYIRRNQSRDLVPKAFLVFNARQAGLLARENHAVRDFIRVQIGHAVVMRILYCHAMAQGRHPRLPRPVGPIPLRCYWILRRLSPAGFALPVLVPSYHSPQSFHSHPHESMPCVDICSVPKCVWPPIHRESCILSGAFLD